MSTPDPPARAETIAGLRQRLHDLQRSERSRPTVKKWDGSPGSPHLEIYGWALLHQGIQAQRQAIAGLDGYDALRTTVLRLFGTDLSIETLDQVTSELLKRDIVASASEADSLTLRDAAEKLSPKRTRGSKQRTGSDRRGGGKRVTDDGDPCDSDLKLVAHLTQHHRYAAGDLNPTPIGNNELAQATDLSKSTVSSFFKRKFRGHRRYKALCDDPRRLVAALKLLNGEYAPHLLLGTDPPVGSDMPDE